ncbi:GtrA family protein, partial [Clostridioides difficile]|nr:GtrA family protein [Clostridioides difficile]
FINDIIVKVFTNIIVIVLNYVFSKMIIFKKL